MFYDSLRANSIYKMLAMVAHLNEYERPNDLEGPKIPNTFCTLFVFVCRCIVCKNNSFVHTVAAAKASSFIFIVCLFLTYCVSRRYTPSWCIYKPTKLFVSVYIICNKTWCIIRDAVT